MKSTVYETNKYLHLLALPICLILSINATTDLYAATFTVTTTNISGPGSLPVAIAQANATQETNDIYFAVTNVITLGVTLPTITNNVSIIGRTDVPTVISGGGRLPLFTFAKGTTNILSNLVLENGSVTGSGAAISNSSTLSVIGCVIMNHNAVNGSGGAIFNSGVMTISSSTISGNQATNGGAIFNTGSLAISIVTMTNNLAMAGFGGAIYNMGTLTIQKSTFVTNQTIGASGQSSGSYQTNIGVGGGGGGGGGGGFGGAIFSASGTVGITNSTFFQNAAIGGGINGYVNNEFGGGGNGGGPAGGSGGQGSVSFEGLSGEAGGFGSGGGGGGGGGWDDSDPHYLGGTGGHGGFGGGAGGSGGEGGDLSGTGGNYGNGGNGFGGAIFVQAGTLSLVNCTIAVNSCTGGLGATQGEGYAGGICNYGGDVYLLNTIVATNNAPSGSPDLVGSFLSLGYNLIGDNQGATNLSIFDFQNVTADLGPLQDNGGSTLTCAPLQGSLAIDGGNSAGAPVTDQRGVPRPQGGAFDIGAVEVVTGSPFVTGGAMLEGSGFYLVTIFDETNSYRIQASSNLTTWINLVTNSSGGALNFIDTAATNLNQRFYRAATP